MSKAKKLPTKMSALIRVALDDLKKVEKDKKYEVRMGRWHAPDCTAGVCRVCLAGSVMAKSLNTPIFTRENDLWRWDIKTIQQMYALNELRMGEVSTAAGELSQWLSEKARNKARDIGRVRIPDYRPSDPSTFHKAMRKLAAKLEKAGL